MTQQGTACATLDASLKDGQIAGYWHIKDSKNELLLNYSLHYKQWDSNAVIGLEAITLLELINLLCKKGTHIIGGEM